MRFSVGGNLNHELHIYMKGIVYVERGQEKGDKRERDRERDREGFQKRESERGGWDQRI